MKTIVSIWNSGNKGKTETIKEFANILLLTFPNVRPIFPINIFIPTNGDFRLVIEINGKIIGVESQGDPNTDLQNRLLDLSDNFNCDIIICSTRTRGDTIKSVENLAETRNYNTIWTSTYQIENGTQYAYVNQLKAKHILDLLQSLQLL